MCFFRKVRVRVCFFENKARESRRKIESGQCETSQCALIAAAFRKSRRRPSNIGQARAARSTLRFEAGLCKHGKRNNLCFVQNSDTLALPDYHYNCRRQERNDN